MLLDDAGGSSGDMIGLGCCFTSPVLAGGGPFDLLHPTIRKEARHNAGRNAALQFFKRLAMYSLLNRSVPFK
jgi:hypothetical protein